MMSSTDSLSNDSVPELKVPEIVDSGPKKSQFAPTPYANVRRFTGSTENL